MIVLTFEDVAIPPPTVLEITVAPEDAELVAETSDPSIGALTGYDALDVTTSAQELFTSAE